MITLFVLPSCLQRSANETEFFACFRYPTTLVSADVSHGDGCVKYIHKKSWKKKLNPSCLSLSLCDVYHSTVPPYPPSGFEIKKNKPPPHFSWFVTLKLVFSNARDARTCCHVHHITLTTCYRWFSLSFSLSVRASSLSLYNKYHRLSNGSVDLCSCIRIERSTRVVAK